MMDLSTMVLIGLTQNPVQRPAKISWGPNYLKGRCWTCWLVIVTILFFTTMQVEFKAVHGKAGRTHSS